MEVRIEVAGIISLQDGTLSKSISVPMADPWYLVIVGEDPPTCNTKCLMCYIYKEGKCYICNGFTQLVESILCGECPKLPVISQASLNRPSLITELYGPEIMEQINDRCREWTQKVVSSEDVDEWIK